MEGASKQIFVDGHRATHRSLGGGPREDTGDDLDTTRRYPPGNDLPGRIDVARRFRQRTGKQYDLRHDQTGELNNDATELATRSRHQRSNHRIVSLVTLYGFAKGLRYRGGRRSRGR